ncbi:MAG: hypothetical protein GY841_12185 [FCB group bacterium]|nr:hypothetical protein [FCB group bacterium]
MKNVGQTPAIADKPGNGNEFRQLVCFTAAGRDYGVDIGYVRRIIETPVIEVDAKGDEFLSAVAGYEVVSIPLININIDTEKETTAGSKRAVVIENDGNLLGVKADIVTQIVRIPHLYVAECKPLGFETDPALEGVYQQDDEIIHIIDCRRLVENQARSTVKIGAERICPGK